MKNLYIIDVNEYNKIFEKPTNGNDEGGLEQLRKIHKYELVIFNELVFRNRNQLFIIINRFLGKKMPS
jgi:hypothetical protein|tara:strand:- start:3363 stop:3566 length:204 start_codon:yes stop_codon:yes gene_type:complete